MASLFKPPESFRRNSKSPKLKLPPALKYTTNDIEAQASGSTPNIMTPISSTSSKTITIPYSNKSSSSSSSITTLKKRPVPPPIPQLCVNGESTPVDSKTDVEAVRSSISNLYLDKAHLSHNNGSASSIDSYPSAVVQIYDSASSEVDSPRMSPLRESKTRSADIDELEDESWQNINLEDQICELGVLGEGAGGSVSKCRLKNGKTIFALKTITTLNSEPDIQKQIFRELQFNKSCKSDYIVRYYGMFVDESTSSIYIAMEYMGGRSLDAVYKHLLKRGGRISEKVLGKIAEYVLRGLSYLHERKIIHRDIKPQNILLNMRGQVKLCDFGVSGEAVNSLATTFTGTSYYMAPERIQGQPYSVTSDVWSLGLTLLEVAQGRFPFGGDKIVSDMPPIELLMLILTFHPQLRDEEDSTIVWSSAFKSFIEYCLKKESRERPSPRQILQHPWILGQMKKKVNMEKFIARCWEQ
ncbi:LAMI_0H05908g1_1 [Lachancea mirantina]|uniref:mitogen-activated protein kinase kinase n=1 Tax=Lachancea mirantina TaxID=1230905 RepID=A0A1G4KFE5_9SACH|nr:LAMI_0H05908g1_1 [Lachancea mirantina]